MDRHVTDAPRAHRPLEGVTVLDLSTYVAGPSASMTLAQLGARVVRIDPLGGATDTRRAPVTSDGTSLYWAGLNKGKKSIVVDTRSPEGRGLVMSMLGSPGDGGGIVLTNAVAANWLSYEALKSHRADVILVHILGHSDGTPAVDYTVNCEVGLPLLTGSTDHSQPVNHVLPAWDLLTGAHAALAVVTAERERTRTGLGCHVQISLADVAIASMAHLGFVADVVVNRRTRAREGNFLYGSFGCDFATSDGKRVMVVALTVGHWNRLLEVTGVGPVINALAAQLAIDLSMEHERYEHRQVLAALLAPWFESRTLAEVTDRLERSGVLWGRYRDVVELVHDPDSLIARSDRFSVIDQPGVGPYPAPASVIVGSGWDVSEPMPAPRLGEHTTSVLRDLAGLDEGCITDLRERGVVAVRRE